MSFCVQEPELVVPAEEAGNVNSAMFLSNMDLRFTHSASSVRLVLFYKAALIDKSGELLEKFKSGLRELLIPYHFIAGRLCMNHAEKRLEVHCNGAGVLFAYAYSSVSVADAQRWCSEMHPDLDKFVLRLPQAAPYAELPLATVQVTRLSCGGLALGFALHQALMDATSTMHFVKNFMSILQRGHLLLKPNPDRSMLKARAPLRPTFRHMEFSMEDATLGRRSEYDYALEHDPPLCQHLKYASRLQLVHFSEDHSKLRSYHFGSYALRKLTDWILKDGVISECSVVEALAAHAWQVHAKCTRRKAAIGKSSLVVLLDTRNVLKQHPLGANFCGNAAYPLLVKIDYADLLEKPPFFVVDRIQRSIQALTEEYLRSGIDFLEMRPAFDFHRREVDVTTVAFSPEEQVYGMDFGWGEPACVAWPHLNDLKGTRISILPQRDGYCVSVVDLEERSIPTFEELILHPINRWSTLHARI